MPGLATSGLGNLSQTADVHGYRQLIGASLLLRCQQVVKQLLQLRNFVLRVRAVARVASFADKLIAATSLQEARSSRHTQDTSHRAPWLLITGAETAPCQKGCIWATFRPICSVDAACSALVIVLVYTVVQHLPGTATPQNACISCIDQLAACPASQVDGHPHELHDAQQHLANATSPAAYHSCQGPMPSDTAPPHTQPVPTSILPWLQVGYKRA